MEEKLNPKYESFTAQFDKDSNHSEYFTISDDGKKAIRNDDVNNQFKILRITKPVPEEGKWKISFKIHHRDKRQNPSSLFLGTGTSDLFMDEIDPKRNFYSFGCASGSLCRNGPIYGGG